MFFGSGMDGRYLNEVRVVVRVFEDGGAVRSEPIKSDLLV